MKKILKILTSYFSPCPICDFDLVTVMTRIIKLFNFFDDDDLVTDYSVITNEDIVIAQRGRQNK